jgi:hypothetical protein
MHVGEEVVAQVVAQVLALAVDRGGVLGPGCVQEGGGGVAEAVGGRVGGQRAVEEQDAVREGVAEVRGLRIEDAELARGVEAAERRAEGEAEVVGGGLGVEDLGVGREGGVLGAVDGELGPVLGVAPGAGTGVFELDGGLAVGFVEREG